ncbi:MAG: DUF4136 domain-containing protein [Weeksellaceae bacterium]|nr:DUF4136 domain-containing protein [Weeksellaceae bacterium]
MKRIYGIVAVIVLFALTSCNTVRVSSDYDRQTNFSELRTFAFHEQGLADLNMNDLDKRRVVTAITSELSSKGMTMNNSATAADIIVNISAKHTNRVNYNQWYSPWWGWGPMWGGMGMGHTSVNQYKEGTLILDFVDRRRNVLVWQGVASGMNISRLEKKEENIPAAVKRILEKFPPSN